MVGIARYVGVGAAVGGGGWVDSGGGVGSTVSGAGDDCRAWVSVAVASGEDAGVVAAIEVAVAVLVGDGCLRGVTVGGAESGVPVE